jgi:hypothetical protein
MPSRSPEPRRRLSALHQRWGIETHDGAEFHKFRTRFFYLADSKLDWDGFYKDGTHEHFHLIHASGSDLFSIREWLRTPNSLPEFMAMLQMFLWAMEDAGSDFHGDVITMLSAAKRYSPGINFGIARRGDSVTLYPQGAQELDVALVEEPMEWLARYPKVAEQFGQALRIVLANDEDNYRGALDNLRWALEQLLKAVLSNHKSLEKQSEFLLPWLKARGVHAEVRSMYRDLLLRFANYQNDAVKHGDKWQPIELEFMIYTTGALMRLAIQAAETPLSEESETQP